MSGKLENKKINYKSFLKVTANVAKLLFIPHHANNYKPHIIRSYGIILVLATVVGLNFGYNSIRTGAVLGQKTEITISSLLDQTNLQRTNAGLRPLILNDKLNQAAYLKAQDMFNDQYWAHNAPDGTPPWKWFGDVGYNYNQAGENLAKNFTTTAAAMVAWMNSPEHKANILEANYSEVGFAVVSGQLDNKPTSIVVALYGAPAESAVMGMNRFSTADSIGNINILDKMGIAISSITPLMLLCIILVVSVMVVSLASHAHRHKLPKKLARSWRRNHGLYKGIGLATFIAALIIISSVGQI
jgi:hypothetical protein